LRGGQKSVEIRHSGQMNKKGADHDGPAPISCGPRRESGRVAIRRARPSPWRRCWQNQPGR
jgi:hypothetical protein